MGKIYVGQTALVITVGVRCNITGATCTIKYKKPNGARGEFAATIVNATTGVIRYTVSSSSDIDQAGLWSLWAYVVFSDGTVAAGESCRIKIYKEGE